MRAADTLSTGPATLGAEADGSIDWAIARVRVSPGFRVLTPRLIVAAANESPSTNGPDVVLEGSLDDESSLLYKMWQVVVL